MQTRKSRRSAPQPKVNCQAAGLGGGGGKAGSPARQILPQRPRQGRISTAASEAERSETSWSGSTGAGQIFGQCRSDSNHILIKPGRNTGQIRTDRARLNRGQGARLRPSRI